MRSGRPGPLGLTHALLVLVVAALVGLLVHLDLVVAGASGGLVGSLLVAWWAHRRVTRPLRELAETSRAIATGDRDRDIRTSSDDEIGGLARAVQAMVEVLRERVRTIARDRNQLAAILSSMVEGVLAVDEEERVVHVSEVAGEILGVDPDEARGKRILEVTRIPEIGGTVRRAIESGREIAEEVSLVEGRREQIVELTAAPLRDAEGRRAGAVLVLHDVTELRRLERARSEFVANVSHELKTPLTAIRGFLETVAEDGSMAEERRDRFLRKALTQTDRLGRLVQDTLTLSRIESEGDRLESRPVDARRPVEASLRGLRPVAEEKDLSLESELPSDPVTIPGDPEALRGVVDNLVSNAISYTPEGGRVVARVRGSDGRAVVEIEDTGLGIEPKDRDRIFERFYRVDRARSKEVGGTGLGLAIVKHTVLALGGNVEVDSVPGEGSTFRVLLPLHDDEE